jgi:hypothetical protein
VGLHHRPVHGTYRRPPCATHRSAPQCAATLTCALLQICFDIVLSHGHHGLYIADITVNVLFVLDMYLNTRTAFLGTGFPQCRVDARTRGSSASSAQ